LGVWAAGIITDSLGNQHLRLGGGISDTLSGPAGMDIQIDGGDWQSADAIGAWTYLLPNPNPLLPDVEVEVNWWYTATDEIVYGVHTFGGRARDLAGNVEEAHDIVPDTVPLDWPLPEGLDPDLGGSTMSVVPEQVRPGETVTYTIRLRNSGLLGAMIAVTDTLPTGLTALTSTIGSDGVYDPATGVITWPAELMWPGESARLTFSALVDESLGATTLENEAVARAFWLGLADYQEETITVTVEVDPDLPATSDAIPPQNVSLTIEQGQVVTDSQQVGLRIAADVDANGMYLREWTWDATAGAWTVAQESGWIHYATAYTWTLSEGDGVKYLGLWVSDEASNVSILDEGTLEFTNLMSDSQSLEDGGRVQYRFDLHEGEEMTLTLTALDGDPDLYAWSLPNTFYPNYFSNNTGDDALNFWAEGGGLYLVEVAAVGDSQYRLSLAGDVMSVANVQARQGKLPPEHPLTISTPLSVGGLAAPTDPPVFHDLYLPLILRGS
jgi:uncharacterized repeat protein (TIGR01451 family)